MAEGPNERLDSWKEIAAYLRRNERTVMRWAEKRGLPVHRMPGGSRSAVFAYKREIDDWLAGNDPGMPDGVHGLAPGVEVADSSGYGAGQEQPLVSPRRGARFSPLIGAAAGILVLSVAAILLVYPRFRSGAPVRADFEGNSVRAWDAANRMVWKYRFPQSLETITAVSSRAVPGDVRVEDLFGDGRREVLAIARFAPNQAANEIATDALYCFSPDGKVLWEYEPQFSLTFGDRHYGPPWQMRDLVVSSGAGRKTMWIVGEEAVWSKSFVARIDAAGHSTIQFVNSGEIAALNRTETAQGGYLWIGGFNDEYDSGSLAVMKDDQTFASSPQTAGTRFACIGCPPGTPLAYFVFPHYEIGRLLNPTDLIVRILPEGSIVNVIQGEISSDDTVIYEFSNTISPAVARVDYSETFWPHHEELEREGKIHHTLAQCPDRLHPPPVRVFENGEWHTVPVVSDYSQR